MGERATPRADAIGIWRAGVQAVDGGRLVRGAVRTGRGELRVAGTRVPLDRLRRLVAVGAGKASAAMAEGLEAALRPALDRGLALTGLVNVPDRDAKRLEHIVLHPARSGSENRPTAAGVEGAARILELAASAGARDLVVVLLSGGGSALLPLPAGAVTLEDKQRATGLLHACGATINEMNAVRKHLSRLKGGGLAAATRAPVVSLILSDVVGDPVDVIASGPTAPDPTTFADAWGVLEKYRLTGRVPSGVAAHLARGRDGGLPETPKRLGPRVVNAVIGNGRVAIDAAAREARLRGYRVVDLGSFVEGESREVGTALAGLVASARRDARPARPPVCILSGGETTVRLGPDPGKGGRNQELALAALAHLGEAGLKGAAFFSGGTDGEDGPTDAAGAVADAAVAARARRSGLDPRAYLDRHDAYTFFDRTGGLVRTGSTRTNVMDLRVITVHEDPRRRPGGFSPGAGANRD